MSLGGSAARRVAGARRALILPLALILVSCARRESGGSIPRSEAGPSSAARDSSPGAARPAPPPRRPSYVRVPVGGSKGLENLERTLGPERFQSMLEVNRVDRAHVRDRDTLTVPDSLASLARLSPFPAELRSEAGRGKLLLVSLRVQAFAAYDSGRQVRWGPTSTGREALPTPRGLYHTNWKDRERVSTFNDEWKLEWYVNLENFLGISFHLYELPGHPASHSCVRLGLDDAQWLFDWCESWLLAPGGRHVIRPGTPVVVFGRYDYRAQPPWKRLAADSTATDVPLDEVAEALGTYLPRDTTALARRDAR